MGTAQEKAGDKSLLGPNEIVAIGLGAVALWRIRQRRRREAREREQAQRAQQPEKAQEAQPDGQTT